jgi:hypothetical protein
MQNVEKLSLKAFWEAVEQRLAASSADELRAVLRVMAQETPPSERQGFLAKLTPPQTTPDAAPRIPQEELLAEIADLAQEIEAEMENAEEWVERYEWDEDYDDEDSLGQYEEFIAPLTALFDQTQTAFDYGDFPLACAAYQQLFALLQTEDEYGRGVHLTDLSGINAEETVARYLRALYETTAPAERPAALYAQMPSMRTLLRRRVMLDDLIQISPRPMPDQNTFLEAWIAHLRAQDAPSGSDADAWLREAVWLAQGVTGLADLARAEGVTRPRAYLDWFIALLETEQYAEVVTAAQAALQTLPAERPIRAAIADQLCEAAAKLNQPTVVREGRWQAFFAKPTETRLLDLWEAEPDPAARLLLMQQALRRVQTYKPSASQPNFSVWNWGDTLETPASPSMTLLAHACMLAGEWDAAQQLAAPANVLGWTSATSHQALVVAVFLALLAGETPAALTGSLAQIWKSGVHHSAGFLTDSALSLRFDHAYTAQFAQTQWPNDVQARYLAWCLDVARRRVEAIVGGQHRKSYDKAAILTAACAETLRQRGDQAAATAFVSEIRTRFPRHSAFQAELKRALR